MEERDRAQVLEMMRVFYSSEAVMTNGSEEIFNNDINECVSESPFAEGFVFTDSDDEHLLGYAMLAHSFSTEYGRPVIWIEDLFLEEDERGKGLGVMLFDMVKEKYPDHIHRLEVEETNLHAIRVYKKSGFTTLPYAGMIREPEHK